MSTATRTIESKILGKKMNIAVYCPDGYEDYFVREVVPFADSNFATVKNRKSRFIGGVSAGGYSALHIGLRHSDIFSKIGGHMPAIDLSYADEDECYFSDGAMWKKYDSITIAANKNFDGISVFLDAGNNDEGQFYRACEKLYPILKSKGVDIQNHIFDGHHNGKYIMSNMKSYLRFYGA